MTLKAFKVAENLEISRIQLYNLDKGKYILDLNKIERLSEAYKRIRSKQLQRYKKMSVG